MRALWHWRDEEAQAADRPSFHILQNHLLIQASLAFDAGDVPDYRHFSPRRRRTFMDAAQQALNAPQSEWPERRRRVGKRLTREMEKAADALRKRRDEVATEHGIDPSFIAARGALDAVAADQTASATLLAPWQRDLLHL